MNEIKRYKLNNYQREWGSVDDFEEDSNGEIVLYADHLTVVNAKEAEWHKQREELEAKIKGMQEVISDTPCIGHKGGSK